MIIKTKNIHPIIKSLVPVIKTISGMFGKNCEVVLHDFSGPQHSIIAITNGHVTGRKKGDPITDLALEYWRKGGFGSKKEEKMLNYQTKTKDGKILKSSSVFIKDENRNIVGCLCINYDMSGHLLFNNIMNEFCSIVELSSQKDGIKEEETFAKDVDEVLEVIIKNAIKEINKPISLMNKVDNLRIVEIVGEKGGFMIKGSVNQLAHTLSVSRYTIYNYLEELKIKKRMK